MPSHTHTVGSNSTGITTNTNAPSVGLVQRSGSNTGTTFDASAGELDLINATNLTLTDPTHSHPLSNTGGSNAHNNIQPTLVIGNMFIYSGKAISPITGFPYTENTQIL